MHIYNIVKRDVIRILIKSLSIITYTILSTIYAQPEFPLVAPYLYPIENDNGYPHLKWTKDNPDNRFLGYYIYKKITLSNGQVDTLRYFTMTTTYLDTTFNIGGNKPWDIAEFWVIVLGKTDGRVDTSKPLGPRNIHGHSNIDGSILLKSRKTDEYSLYKNCPNPFNSTTLIKFSLFEDSFIELIIYDLMGREIKTFMNRFETAGLKSVTWDGKDSFGNSVSSGLYLYEIVIRSIIGEVVFHRTGEMILLR